EAEQEAVVSSLLSQACMAVPLVAATKASVLRELVRLAEQSWQGYDPAGLLDALKLREEMGTTALPSGVAIPHPRRSLPSVLRDSLPASGRPATGIPFGAAHGALPDIFSLVCSRDERSHMRILARLSRLLLRPGFVDDLRAAGCVTATWQVI